MGPLQTGSGLISGPEAATHAMITIFDDEESDGVILVDESNAFNSMNKMVALHNVRVICPSFSTVLINMYRAPARLFISGGGEILSMERTTQGDNLAMSFYAVGASVQIYSNNTARQIWLADDASAGGKLDQLKTWWENVIREGERFGYIMNKGKSWLILKDAGKVEYAKQLFDFSTSPQKENGT